MKTIWTFGDSYTAGFNSDEEWCDSYCKWKGYTPKVYGEIISDKLNLNLNNKGKGATNNYYIFQQICDSINEIQSDDIVIISWTQLHRFRLINKDNEWEDFYNNKEHYRAKLKKCNGISENTINQIIYNRLNDKWIIELENWEKLIKLALKDTNLIFWSPFTDFELGEIRFKLETITKETNGYISDPHFSESGQHQLAFILMDRLNIKNDKRLC